MLENPFTTLIMINMPKKVSTYVIFFGILLITPKYYASLFLGLGGKER
jgi:hypothetical protein